MADKEFSSEYMKLKASAAPGTVADSEKLAIAEEIYQDAIKGNPVIKRFRKEADRLRTNWEVAMTRPEFSGPLADPQTAKLIEELASEQRTKGKMRMLSTREEAQYGGIAYKKVELEKAETALDKQIKISEGRIFKGSKGKAIAERIAAINEMAAHPVIAAEHVIAEPNIAQPHITEAVPAVRAEPAIGEPLPVEHIIPSERVVPVADVPPISTEKEQPVIAEQVAAQPHITEPQIVEAVPAVRNEPAIGEPLPVEHIIPSERTAPVADVPPISPQESAVPLHPEPIHAPERDTLFTKIETPAVQAAESHVGAEAMGRAEEVVAKLKKTSHNAGKATAIAVLAAAAVGGAVAALERRHKDETSKTPGKG